MQKIIGTSVPLTALWSADPRLSTAEGTTAVGHIFLDWLERTEQHAWQLLPLSETHLEPGSSDVHVPSPYKGYGIGLHPAFLPPDMKEIDPSPNEELVFRQTQGAWIEDYAFFCALRDHFGTDDWSTWDPDIRDRLPEAMPAWQKLLHDAINAHIRVQWRLHAAFTALRDAAHDRNIMLIGDLPFYLPFQSPLVWAHRECFMLADDGTMEYVSGIPDGPKSHFGRQEWGHPLYEWNGPKSFDRIIALWKIRVEYFSRFYDTMRLDHAKGLFNFGAMHTTDRTKDTVMPGPGAPALEAIIACGTSRNFEFFAEDAGDRLEELRKTLHRLDVPGIRILRFGYNEKRKKFENDYSDVANYPPNTYALSSTHDTITLASYFDTLTPEERNHLTAHVGIEDTDDRELFILRMIGAIVASKAKTILVPVQDWLQSTTRINVPGTEIPTNDPNWRYRIEVPVEELPDISGHTTF